MTESINDVITASEITAQVGVTHKTVVTQCLKWSLQKKARLARGTWLVDRKTAEQYIREHSEED